MAAQSASVRDDLSDSNGFTASDCSLARAAAQAGLTHSFSGNGPAGFDARQRKSGNLGGGQR